MCLGGWHALWQLQEIRSSADCDPDARPFGGGDGSGDARTRSVLSNTSRNVSTAPGRAGSFSPGDLTCAVEDFAPLGAPNPEIGGVLRGIRRRRARLGGPLVIDRSTVALGTAEDYVGLSARFAAQP